MHTSETIDKAGTEYWDALWQRTKPVIPVDPNSRKLRNYVYREFHAYFKETFDLLPTSNMNIIEVGCANSRWLPYFAKEFGFKVAGLDRSETGCKLASEVLLHANIDGKIVCGDIFNPPKSVIGMFDVVVSFGVIEHFTNSLDCLKAIKLLLRPGGIIITVVPNLNGILGFIGRILNREIFNKHIVIDTSEVRQIHQEAGFAIEDCRYLCNMNFGLLTAYTAKTCNTSEQSFVKRGIVSLLTRVGFLCHWFETAIGKLPCTNLSASYVICRGKLQNK